MRYAAAARAEILAPAAPSLETTRERFDAAATRTIH